MRNRYVTRYPHPYVVQARYAEQFTIAAPRPAAKSGARSARVHAYVAECIRRGYVRAHAKKRSCSIAGVSAFRLCLDRVPHGSRESLSNEADNEVETVPRSMLRLLSPGEGRFPILLFFFLSPLFPVEIKRIVFSSRQVGRPRDPRYIYIDTFVIFRNFSSLRRALFPALLLEVS